MDITNTTVHRIKSKVISVITLIILIESSDDKILDAGDGDSDDKNEEDINDDNSAKNIECEKYKKVILLDVIVCVFDDDTKKKKKTLNYELPDCVKFNIHGLVNREVVGGDKKYWTSDRIIDNKVYDYAVIGMTIRVGYMINDRLMHY